MTVKRPSSTAQRWPTAWVPPKTKSCSPGRAGVGVDRREVDQVAGRGARPLEGLGPAAGAEPVGRRRREFGRRKKAEDVRAGAADQHVGAALPAIRSLPPAPRGCRRHRCRSAVVQAVAGADSRAGADQMEILDIGAERPVDAGANGVGPARARRDARSSRRRRRRRRSGRCRRRRPSGPRRGRRRGCRSRRCRTARPRRRCRRARCWPDCRRCVSSPLPPIAFSISERGSSS